MAKPSGKKLAAFARGGKATRLRIVDTDRGGHEERIKAADEKRTLHQDEMAKHPAGSAQHDEHMQKANEAHAQVNHAVKAALKDGRGKIQRGERGGQFYLSPGGQKVYVTGV
jgi:SLT domain-containing protein